MKAGSSLYDSQRLSSSITTDLDTPQSSLTCLATPAPSTKQANSSTVSTRQFYPINSAIPPYLSLSNVNVLNTDGSDPSSSQFKPATSAVLKKDDDQTQASTAPSKSTAPLNRYASSSRQNQSKRQREWVYLSHYIMISGLNPLHIISGKDDGREPDFTLIFYHQSRLYYVGIELTTLPRLWDQMGETALIARRWYWQGLQIMMKQRQKQASYYQRFRLPVKTLYSSLNDCHDRLLSLPRSVITQRDVDAAMQKKAHKVAAYHERRPLDELWLLIHTDKYQCHHQYRYKSNRILTEPAAHIQLSHNSDFDQVHITRYPSHKLIEVIPRFPQAAP